MEKESFEEEEVASLLNSHFISIKIDREERPDLDSIYMEAVQLLTGTGGWPLTCIALPDGRPIFGGTYIPKPKLIARLNELIDVKQNEYDRLTDFATKVKSGVDHLLSVKETTEIKSLSGFIEGWKEIWDKKNGQFLGAPKFPIPTNLNFLLDYGKLCGDADCTDHAFLTLVKIHQGGLFDHIRGGFYRYSVDENWDIPHFEKMLYDTAQLIGTYSKAHNISPSPSFKHAVYRCIDFLNSELLSPTGCFYSALDADSDGEEGKFYAFNEKDLVQILSKNDLQTLLEFYTIRTGYFTLKTEEVIDSKTRGKLDSVVDIIKQHQNNRIRPGLDDKILTSWNSLTVSGLCSAYETFRDSEILKTARYTLDYILNNFFDENSVLSRAFHSKKGNYIDGFLDDYAYTIEACLNMYNCTLKIRYLNEALALTFSALDLFYDRSINGFGFTPSNSSQLFSQKQEIVDSVLPSASSVMASNLLSLGRHFSRTEWISMAESMTNSALGNTTHFSRSTNWASVHLQLTLPHYQFTFNGSDLKAISTAHLELLGSRPIYSTLVGPNHPLASPTPDALSIIVCTNGVCLLPSNSVQEALAQIH